MRFISLMFLALGGATWMGSYLVYSFWGIVSTKVGFYYWREYLKAILKQDAAWFESFDILSLPSKVSKECLSVESAAGEKLANIIQAMISSVGGLVIAFIIGWKFAFVCLGMFPFMVIAIAVMTICTKAKGKSKNYDKAAAYAEQALTLIWIVIAFGQEKLELANFNQFLRKSKKDGNIASVWFAFGVSFINQIFILMYTYGLALGGVFVHKKITTGQGGVYEAGDVISVFFGIIFGIFSFGLASPHI